MCVLCVHVWCGCVVVIIGRVPTASITGRRESLFTTAAEGKMGKIDGMVLNACYLVWYGIIHMYGIAGAQSSRP